MDFDVINDGQDRASWLEARRAGIGGSDAPGILGASPWSSPLAVFADKTLPPLPDDNIPERFYWGRKLEPAIVARFSEETGRVVELDGALLRNKKRPWQMVTLDATQTSKDHKGKGFLEVKNTRFKPDGVPEHYWIQMQHQFAVTGFGWGSFAVLVSGCEFYWCDVERDDEFINGILIPEERGFWERILAGGPTPSVDASAATTEALKRMFPKDNGDIMVLPPEFNDDDRERLVILEDEHVLRDRKAAIDNRIKAAIGSASIGVLPNGRQFTFKANKNGVRILRAPKAEATGL